MFPSRKMPRIVEQAQNDERPVTAPIVLSQIEWPEECEAMAVCHTALTRLDPDARKRSLAWLAAVFEDNGQ